MSELAPHMRPERSFQGLILALLAPLFFSGRLTDMRTIGRLRPVFTRASALNHAMQPLLRAWGERNAMTGEPPSRLLDQARIEWFHALNEALGESSTLDDDAFVATMEANVERMRVLAAEILGRARETHADIDAGELGALVAGAGGPALLAPHWYGAAATADA